MFRGKHLLALDKKGRFAVPVRYREQIRAKNSSEVVITPHLYEPCLVVYPLHEWDRVQERLSQHPGRHPNAGEEERVQADWISRHVVGNAEDGALDSHGRLLIASDLRKHLGLVQNEQRENSQAQERQQVRLVGQIETFELWKESTWNERSRQQFERNRRVVDQVMNSNPAASSNA